MGLKAAEKKSFKYNCYDNILKFKNMRFRTNHFNII